MEYNKIIENIEKPALICRCFMSQLLQYCVFSMYCIHFIIRLYNMYIIIFLIKKIILKTITIIYSWLVSTYMPSDYTQTYKKAKYASLR